MRPIRLTALGSVDPVLLEQVRISVVREYRVPCRIAAPSIDPGFAFRPERGQYHSTVILERLAAMNGSEIIVGVTSVDLFIPILTYVFGEAQMGGSAAVISFPRFAQEFYGLPPDPLLTVERLTKTVIHEVGHTLALTHCDDFECVMAASHAVEFMDLKSTRLCGNCRAKVG